MEKWKISSLHSWKILNNKVERRSFYWKQPKKRNTIYAAQKCGNRVHYGLPTKGSENKCTKCGAIVLTSITDDGKCTTQLRPKGRKLKAQKQII